MLADGMGGIQWGALDLAAAHYGASDLALLIERLITIKLHKPATPGESA